MSHISKQIPGDSISDKDSNIFRENSMFLNFNAAGTFNYLVAKETDGHFNFILHPIELEYSELAYLGVCLLLRSMLTTYISVYLLQVGPEKVSD